MEMFLKYQLCYRSSKCDVRSTAWVATTLPCNETLLKCCRINKPSPTCCSNLSSESFRAHDMIAGLCSLSFQLPLFFPFCTNFFTSSTCRLPSSSLPKLLQIFTPCFSLQHVLYSKCTEDKDYRFACCRSICSWPPLL